MRHVVERASAETNMRQAGRLTDARVGVLMGGTSSEREVSLRTGRAIYEALVRLGYDAVLIDVNERLPQELKRRKVDVAFVSLHGPGGEDGTIQGFLETISLPYTGSGVQSSAVSMHKVMTKVVLAAHDIPVPPGLVVPRGDVPSLSHVLKEAKLKLPVIVKPVSQGSTIGVTIVRQARHWKAAVALAHQYDAEAMVEAFIPGHEVTVAVLGGVVGPPKVLPAVEIVAPDGFYDFAAKYQKGKTQYLCPAPLPVALSKRIEALALRTFHALGCEGAARVDFRITPKGRPYVLEINTVPGMTETSLLPMAAAEAGIAYDRLVERILQSALKRRSRRAEGRERKSV